MIFLSSFMTFPAHNSYCILLNILVLPVKTNNNINYFFMKKLIIYHLATLFILLPQPTIILNR